MALQFVGRRKSIDESKVKVNEGRGVFGVPLETAVLISRVKENYELPTVVYRCIEFLEIKEGNSNF